MDIMSTPLATAVEDTVVGTIADMGAGMALDLAGMVVDTGMAAVETGSVVDTAGTAMAVATALMEATVFRAADIMAVMAITIMAGNRSF